VDEYNDIRGIKKDREEMSKMKEEDKKKIEKKVE
jgi:hypothetical protein